MAAASTVACTLWLGTALLGAFPDADAPAAAATATTAVDSIPAHSALAARDTSAPGATPGTRTARHASAPPSGHVASRTAQGVQGLGGLPIRRLPAPFPWVPEPPGPPGTDDEDEAGRDGKEGAGDGEGSERSPESGDPDGDQDRGGAASSDGESALQLDPPLQDFSVRIVSPEPERAVSGRVSVAAEVRADRPAAVRAVDFIIDGRVLFSDVDPPYEMLWDSGEPASHRIEVEAWGPGRQVVRDALEIRAVAATEGAGPGAAFAARVERVEIHVRVEGADPDVIPARPESFRVLEEGRPQRVLAVERVSDLPVAVGMVVDHSGSMEARLESAMDAAGEFIDGLVTHPNDKAFVMAFSDVPVLLQGFTNDVGRLRESFSLIQGGRYTALYDAVGAASERFAGVEGRRAVVVLTDGADQGSDLDMREAIAAAQRADVAVYPVAVEVGPRFFREQWVMREIATETGGRFFGLAGRDDPAEVYEAIAEDLRSQYRITYAPVRQGGSGEWRTVVVELVEDLADEDVEVRARPGYYAR